MKKKKILIGLLAASTAFALTSCNGHEDSTTDEQSETVTETPTETSSTVEPTSSSTSIEPTQSSTSIEPTQSSTSIEPTSSSTNIEPTQSSTNIEPTQSSTSTEPTSTSTTIEVVATGITIDTSNVKKIFGKGQELYHDNLVVKCIYSDNTEKTLDASEYEVTSNYDKDTLGNYTVTVKAGGFSKTYDVQVGYYEPVKARTKDFTGWTAISSVEDFNNFRTYVGDNTGKYYLANDIDLAGVELAATNVVFFGQFDGNGYAIKNASYTKNAGNKTGLLTKELKGSAVINNVRFVNCVAELQGETIAIVTGMAYGTPTISNVEFNNSSVKCNNYAGLCVGRTNDKAIVLTMQGITCKNGVTSTVTSYGGTLIGDIAAGASATSRATVNLYDCDLDIELKGANLNGGFLSGRIRNNTNFNIKNVLVRNAIIGGDDNTTGLVCGGGSNNAGNSTVTVENLYVQNTNANYLQSCAVVPATNPVTTFEISYINCYVSSNVTTLKDNGLRTGTGAETTNDLSQPVLLAVTPGTDDIGFLGETLKLDFIETWTVEEKNLEKFRLTYSSTNVKSADATIAELKLATANAQRRFEAGSPFSFNGLAVTGIYSDGVNLLLNASDETDGYVVDSSAFDASKAGTYKIVVRSKENAEVYAEYTVEVVVQTDVNVNTEFAKLTYMVGEELDLSKLLVYASWTDGQKLLVTDASRYTTNAASLDMTTAGAKDLTITMAGFDPVHIRISVVDTKPVIVNNYAYIVVDGTANVEFAGQKVNGVETFNTINEAVEYLVSVNLGADVNKVMYINDGTYHEKITIPASLKNLTIVGQSRNNTIIEYDAVEDTVNPLNDTKYTMDCATLHVNAENFGLANITINNSFDYINNNTKYGNPQGFALTIAGDGAVIDNVTLYGNQDTLFFKKGRCYINNSEIDGNIDFIFGENDGLAFFNECTIKAISKSTTPQNNNGYVTAMKGDPSTHPTYGYIFYNCALIDDGKVADGAMSLGRPWGQGASVAYINCSFTKAYSTVAYDGSVKSRWFDMSGNTPVDAFFCEYGSTGEGAIDSAVAGGKVLTAEEAANYTAVNWAKATNGGVKWTADFDYTTALAALQAASSRTTGTEICATLDGDEVAESTSVFFEDNSEFTPYVKEWNATNKDITVAIADETIAKYENGKLYGLTVGNTTITLTCDGLTKSIALEVKAPIPFDVTFVTPGSEVEAQKVNKYKKITPVVTTKDNAIFKGWFYDDKFTQPFDPENDVIIADTTLYAKIVDWTDMYKENCVIYLNGQGEADNIDIFNYVNVTETAGTYYGLTVDGKFIARHVANAANKDVQFNKDVSVAFDVEKYATITFTLRSLNSSELAFYFDGEDVTADVVINDLTYTYETTKAGTFTIKNTGGEGGKNCYAEFLSVIYPAKVITESEKIDFGTEGNYLDAIELNQKDVKYGQIQAKCNQIPSGKLVFYVAPGSSITIAGNWSVGYTINGVEIKTSNAGGESDANLNYTYVCEAGGKVVIEGIHNNNYFYSISITCPVVSDEDAVSTNTTITFGTEGNYTTIKGVTCVGDNTFNTDNTQLNGTCTVAVKAGALVKVYGYGGSAGSNSGDYTDYTVTANGVTSAAQTGDYEVVVEKTGNVVITSTQYLIKIEVTYPDYVELEEITFGTEGNYSTAKGVKCVGDSTFNANNTQLNGTCTLTVKPGALVKVYGYGGSAGSNSGDYTNYTVTANGATSTAQTGDYEVFVTASGEVVITSTQYLIKIEVTYPEVIFNDTTITFGTEGNYTTIKGVTCVGDSTFNTNNTQLNGTCTLDVLAGAKVKVYGYGGSAGSNSGDYTDYTVTANGVTSAAQTGDYEVTVTDAGKVVIGSTQYLIKIEVTY